MDKEKLPFEEIDGLLIKYLTGSANPKERDEAIAWINKDQRNKLHFDGLKDYYQLSKVLQEPSGFDKDKGWERIRVAYYKARFEEKQEENRKAKTRRIIKIGISAAASIFIAFSAGVYVNKMLGLNVPVPNQASYTIEAPFGSKSQMSLPDGTKVWLNSGSKLSYTGNFAKDNRQVLLEGEAFFDVAESKELQFIVKTSSLDIKVYGTRFNVKSYPDENKILTTLVEGSLAIEPHEKKRNEEVLFLEPNQTATFFKESSKVVTTRKYDKTADRKQIGKPQKIEINEKIDPIKVTSWKDNKWIFEGEELVQIAKMLERRYNVRISFENESLKKYKFTGTLLEETFEQVLKVIQISAPIEYSIEKNNVTLIEDKNYKTKYDKMITN